MKNCARRVLQAYQGKLYEDLAKQDSSGDGILPVEFALQALIKKNIAEVEPSELTQLVHACDRNNRGIIVAEYFEKKLNEIAQETDREKLMRRFSRDVASSASSLVTLLSAKDTNRTGKLDFASFKKAVTSTSIAVSESELKSLFEEGQSAAVKDGLDIKLFTDKVAAVFRTKPLVWDFRAPKAGKAKVQTNLPEFVADDN